MIRNLFVVFFALSGLAVAQAPKPVAAMASAYKICDEQPGCYITSMPVGTVYQYGKGSAWTPPATSTAATSLPFLAYVTSFAFDPDPGVVKEFDVQQTASPQTIVYMQAGTSMTIVVPALLPAVAVPLIEWLDVGVDGQTITVPANTILRYGTPSGWSKSMTVAEPATFVASAAYFGAVVAPGSVNRVQVLAVIAQAPAPPPPVDATGTYSWVLVGPSAATGAK